MEIVISKERYELLYTANGFLLASRANIIFGTVMVLLSISCSVLAADIIEPNFAGITLIRDIDYLGSKRAETLDLYIPSEKKNSNYPGIIIIHGGGWFGGDKFGLREQITGTTLAQNGYVCASINYALSESNKPSWPQNIYDCKIAVQFLRKNAAIYNIDPNYIGVIGGSAGGHLAAMLGVANSDATLEPNVCEYKGISTRVQAVVDMYGIADLAKWKSQGACQRYLGYSYEQSPELYAKASPVTHVTDDDPPFLIIHGTKDEVVESEQSQEFMGILRSRKVPVEIIWVADAGHAFHLRLAHQDLRPDIICFFDKHLKGTSKMSLLRRRYAN